MVAQRTTGYLVRGSAHLLCQKALRPTLIDAPSEEFLETIFISGGKTRAGYRTGRRRSGEMLDAKFADIAPGLRKITGDSLRAYDRCRLGRVSRHPAKKTTTPAHLALRLIYVFVNR